MEDGIKALDAGKPAEAEAIFRKLTVADANDYAAWFHLGFSQTLQNKDSEAIESYRKVLAIKADVYEAQLNLGIVLLRQKKAKEAVEPLEAAVKAKPDQYRPTFYLGEALLENGRGAEAEPLYRKAYQLNPKSAEAAHGLGQSLLNQRKTEEGAKYFEEAAQLDASFRPALLQLANVYEADKNFEAAIALYKRFPEEAGARERLGQLLAETGKAAAAIPELEAAVKASPTVANLTALATAYLQNKQPDKCPPLLDAALRLEPSNGELRLLYGRLLREMRKFDQAANQFALAVKLDPKLPEAWSDLATVLVLLERYDIALKSLDQLKALGVEKPGHKYLRAITLDKIKQNKQGAKLALAAYEDFLSSSGGKFPEEEFKARQRMKSLEREVNR